ARPAPAASNDAARTPAPVEAPAPPPATRAASAPPAATPPASTGVFSASDADVVPPLAVRSEYLGELPPELLPLNGRVTIEVVVNERGDVEAAKVNSAPRTIGESMRYAMSLHAVKSWQFRPALKDGVPVKYRQTVAIEPEASAVVR